MAGQRVEGSLGVVLIIGGCGLLGPYTIAELLQHESKVNIHVLDARIPESAAFPKLVTYHCGSVADAVVVDDLVRACRPNVILQMASPRPFAHSMDFYIKVNVNGTRNVLDAARRVGSVRAFVFTASSSIVHDAVMEIVDVDESIPALVAPQQDEAYAHSKTLAESLVLQANRVDGSTMLTASLRPSGLFGPSDEQIVDPIVQSAKAGSLRWQIGANQNLADWTYVTNCARAHVLAAQALVNASHSPTRRPAHERVEGEAFFITNDEPMPFWDFGRSLGAAAGYPTDPAQIIALPAWLAFPIGAIAEWVVWILSLGQKRSAVNRKSLSYSILTRSFDISKAKQRLGYDPAAWVSMEEAIRRASEPYRLMQKATA